MGFQNMSQGPPTKLREPIFGLWMQINLRKCRPTSENPGIAVEPQTDIGNPH